MYAPPEERGDLLHAYHRRLTGSDEAAKAAAATAWSQWEGDTISIRGPEGRPAKFGEVDFAIAFARIECHYFVNRGFFPEDGWILKNAHKLADIPGWIVQGRSDVVTPMETAWALKTAWPKANFEIVWDAGHASTEPGIIDALVRASEAALRL
jgi:proline iminopeptidase